MKQILLTLCIFFVLLTTANAGELYSCIDQNGKEIITSLPQDGMKCALGEVFKDHSPEEIAEKKALEKQKALEEKDKNSLDECYGKAEDNYNRWWEEQCAFLGRKPNCGLPHETSRQLDYKREEERNRCMQYHLNKSLKKNSN